MSRRELWRRLGLFSKRLIAPGRRLESIGLLHKSELPGSKSATVMPAPRPESRYALWGEALGGQANTDGDRNAAGLSRRTGGAVLGADMLLFDNGPDSLRVGVAGGYTQSRFDLDPRLSSGRLESGHAALYAGGRFGAFASMPASPIAGARATSAARSRSADSATCCGRNGRDRRRRPSPSSAMDSPGKASRWSPSPSWR